ncbi:MAG: hypothetical protein HKO66_12675 [Saprospiraceae bacterium]|nr:hypothetical protein [Bacteroidia bacterium]NNL93085.1 hypothetical protein [Saprospiraceae bacterium]
MSEDYLQEIQKIRLLMQDRSRFLSLSGLSGILAGIYALIGAYVAYNLIHHSSSVAYSDISSGEVTGIVLELLIVAAAVFILALGTALFFTNKKAKRQGEKVWTKASYKALVSFSIPLITGGLFVLILLSKNYLYLIAPSCLIFYGVALYSASHYTFRDIGALGIAEILVGLASMKFDGYGLYFWALGFGVLHIIYGVIMYIKYDRD